MRIMIMANNDVGLYQFRKELIEKLLEGNEVVISLPYGELVEPLCNLGCEFINTEIDRRGMNPIHDIKLFSTYMKLIKNVKPDMVILYTIKPNVYGGMASRIKGIPYVVNVTGLGTAFEDNGLIRKLVILMYKAACGKSKVIFFENEENRQIFIKENIAKENQTHRLNGAGVNIVKYSLLEYPSGEKIKFLFMGRLMAEKGVDELLEAMKLLVKDGIKCELDIVGACEEDYREKIEQCQKQGWLHYYGYQKDVRPFIRNCHCFVLPSWHEGMANTNLESAASGRPVITTNIYGCKEAVVDGVSGYLVEKKNVYELYDAMKRFSMLSYSERKNMGLKGRKHMENFFKKEDVVAETVKWMGIL